MAMKSALVPIRSCRQLFSTSVRSAPVVAWSGARQLNVPENANATTLMSFSSKLDNYINNDSIGLVAFSADGGNFFSKHFAHDAGTIQAVNHFSLKLDAFPKHSVLYVEGDVSSSSFSPFAACTFRLGSESTKLILDDFSKGRLPIGGGMSSRLVGTKRDGVAMARYLVSAQVSLSAFDLYKMGLLTHVVPEQALEIVLPVVADVSCQDMTKAFQPRSDRIDSIKDLLDSMHVEVKELGGVFTHKVWSKAVLVPPTQHVTGDELDDTIDAIRDSVVHCFSPDEPEECIKRLELLAADNGHANQSWAKTTLSVLQQNDQQLMKTWFKLTRHVAKKPPSQAMQVEEQLVNPK